MERSSAAASGTNSSGAPHHEDATRSGRYGNRDPQAPHGVTETSGATPAFAWSALGGAPEALERVTVTERPELLPSRLPALELARASVAACGLAAAELARLRAGEGAPIPVARVDDGAVAAAFTSERHLLIDGRPPVNFTPLSRFWPTADGWVRTHANYPHHRSRLLAALGCEDTGDDGALARTVGARLAERRAVDVEEAVCGAGGLAVAVRGQESWQQHPQGARAASRPLLTLDRIDSAPPPPLPGPEGGTPHPQGAMDGVRVLDLTRVIAGPVATRTLAQLGADVLRLDSPQLPESTDAHADTGFGKRSAHLDLSSRRGQAVFEELLASADVVLTGYRPGALDRFGLAPESLADRRPGLVVGQLSAWGAYGPWHRRRGFDSLVQAASGIAVCEAAPDGTPGVLPAQVLDHATGYLLAAAVMRALTEARSVAAGSRVVRTALTQTAQWLLGGSPDRDPRPDPHHGLSAYTDRPAHDPEPWLSWTDSPLGRLRHALPPVAYDGAPAVWHRPPGRPGADRCAWG